MVTNQYQLRRIEIILDNTVKRRLGIGASPSGGAGEQLRQHGATRGFRGTSREKPNGGGDAPDENGHLHSHESSLSMINRKPETLCPSASHGLNFHTIIF